MNSVNKTPKIKGSVMASGPKDPLPSPETNLSQQVTIFLGCMALYMAFACIVTSIPFYYLNRSYTKKFICVRPKSTH